MTTKDHEQLHDWIARGALAGAAVSVLELVSARVGFAELGPLGALLRTVAVVAAIVPPRSIVDGAGLTLLGAAAGAMTRLPLRLALPGVALLVGVGLCRKLPAEVGRWRRRFEVMGIGATAALAAGVIQRAIVEHPELGAWLGLGLVALLGGAVAGAVTGLGAIGRLLRPEAADPIDHELDALATEVAAANAEVGALLRRAAEAHRQAAEVIGGLGGTEAPAAKRAADDLIGRMVRFGREWLEIERRASDMKPEQLTERVAVLETRLEKATDPVARQELGKAIAAVRSQAEALTEILGGRERAVARLEHQVATLERLRLAALRHRSADAGRLQAELQPVVEELADAGGDYDLASDALRDADRETTAATEATPATGTALVARAGEQPN
jgi:hypothetical protein